MFKFISDKQQILRERRRNEALQARQRNTESVSFSAFVSLAETGTIDGTTAAEHIDLFSPWVEGISYDVGAIRQYEGVLYRCVQAHTSQSDLVPDKAPSLWVKIGDPTVEYPQWSQPIGAHDAYNAGDKVSDENKNWISVVDGNVWKPGFYGWEEEK